MSYWVYMLRCRDASYYVGSTNDIECRFSQHQAGEVEGYTQDRRPVRLVLAEEFETRQDAFLRERQLKGWSRAKKEALAKGNWERLKFLARSYDDGTSTSSVHEAAAAAGPSTGSG